MSETVSEQVSDASEDASPNGDGSSLGRRLLIPAAAGIGTLAATYAASKAPGLIRDRLMPEAEERGSEQLAEMGKKAASKMGEQGGVLGAAAKVVGGGGGGGREKTRRLPIQRWTDVAVPLETAYDKWTEFENFPRFMHRVQNVEQKDDDRIAWDTKIWFSTRRWEAEILAERENDRIAWKTIQGTSHNGIVSFHRLDDRLTRVLVEMDFHPSGMIEKMGSGLRFVKRAVQADLARFKAYVEMDELDGAEYTHEATTESGASRDTESGASGDGDASSNGAEREQSRQERAERRSERRS